MSAKLQTINCFSRQLLELCAEWWGPQAFFMVNLKVLGWILHTWTVRPKKKYWMIKHFFEPASLRLQLRTPCSLLGLSRCWAVRLPDSRWISHQIMNECLLSWSHDMSLLAVPLCIWIKIYCSNYGFIFIHIRRHILRTICCIIYF